MEPLRLLHFADLHLGVETGGRTHPATGLNQRIVDACDRLDEVCEVVEADGVHAVIFAGDAFKNQHPTPTLQSLFAARIRRLSRAGAAVFLLVGNHDLPKMAGLAHPFSIYPALEVEGVVVGDRAKVYRLPLRDGATAPVLQIGALPHFSRHQVLARMQDGADAAAVIEERLVSTIRSLGGELDPAAPAVFAGHCHVNTAQVGEAQSLFGVSDIEVPLSTLVSTRGFAAHLLGHVHNRQVLSDDPFVAYSGSLERVDYGEGSRVRVGTDGAVDVREAEPKGFYRLDLTNEDGGWRLAEPPTFRHVHARRFITIRVGALDVHDPVADLESRVRAVRANEVDVTDAFVRLVGVIPAADRARVTSAIARGLIPEAYDVRVAISSDDGPLVRDPRFAERMTEVDALERYLAGRDDWDEDRDELLRAGRELIAEVLS